MTAGQTDSQLTALDWLAAIVCAPLGCILGLIYLVNGSPKAGKMLLTSIIVSVVMNLIGISLIAFVPR
jgi:hypothetical protein